jgi:hypothetical protein
MPLSFRIFEFLQGIYEALYHMDAKSHISPRSFVTLNPVKLNNACPVFGHLFNAHREISSWSEARRRKRAIAPDGRQTGRLSFAE